VAETLVGGRRKRAAAGIAAYVEGSQALGVELRRRRAVVWRTAGGRTRVLGTRPIGRAGFVPLRIRAYGRRVFGFELGARGGWVPVGAARYDAPAWRGETRVVLRVAGRRGARAAFERFSMGPPPRR
jgi:hypothetical protein